MQTHDAAARLMQTALRPDMLPAAVHKSVTDALQQGLGAVVVPPVWVQRVATLLRGEGSGVCVCATVGFPHGGNKSTVKAIEATSCIKDGAEGLWVVPHLPNLIRADLDALKLELLEIARAARATRRDVTIHVVVEAASLPDANLAVACRAARESACDGIVIAANVKTLQTLRPHAEGLMITAHGGVADIETAANLLAAGADRVACERATELAVQLARTGDGAQPAGG